MSHTAPGDRHPDRVPDVVVERYRLGELSPDEAAGFARRLDRDEPLREQLAALAQSDAAIRGDLDWLSAGVRRRITPSARGRPAGRRMWQWVLPAAAAAVLTIAVAQFAVNGQSGRHRAAPGGEDGDRIKGLGATLTVYRRTPSGSELLGEGATARPGDLLRIGYRVTSPGYGVILSIDGRGVITHHLPPDGPRATPLTAGDPVLLDQAFELDDAPQWERFYFVTAATSFDVAPVLAAIRAADPVARSGSPLVLDPALDQFTFVVRKDPRP
jgi:hypothetical protein